MRTWIIIALSWIFLTSASAAEKLPVTAFAQIPTITSMQISPDGRSIAYLQRVDGKYHLYIADVNSDEITPKYAMPPGEASFEWVKWANNDRLIASYIRQTRIGSTNSPSVRQNLLLSMNKKGDGVIELLQGGGKVDQEFGIWDGDILDLLPDEPNHILVGYLRLGDIKKALGIYCPKLSRFPRETPRNFINTCSRQTGSGNVNVFRSVVYKINIQTAEKELIFEPAREYNIYNWYSDLKNKLLVGYGRDHRARHIMLIYRSGKAERKILRNDKLFKQDSFRPLGFDSRSFLVSFAQINGRRAIYRLDLETGELGEKVVEHDKYDITDIILSEKSHKLVAAQYIDDRPKLYFLDEEYASLSKTINDALPDRTNAAVSATPDEKFAIIFSSGARSPGSYYLYKREEQKLIYIGSQFPGLGIENLAAMERVTYCARDNLDIPAYLTLPVDYNGGKLPAIILPHDGLWSRDYQTFNYLAQFLANRGYAVLQPNFRGSIGYGDKFVSAGHGELASVVQNDIADGAKWLIREGIADQDNICIVGAGYGGYAALMGLIRNPSSFVCAAAFAPVTNIVLMIEGKNDNYHRRVAGDLTRKELKHISPIKHVKEIDSPILLVHGDDDGVVPVKHSQKFAKALKKAGKYYEYIEIEGGSHTLDTEEQRVEWLRALEKFLAENLTVKNPESAALE